MRHLAAETERVYPGEMKMANIFDGSLTGKVQKAFAENDSKQEILGHEYLLPQR